MRKTDYVLTIKPKLAVIIRDCILIAIDPSEEKKILRLCRVKLIPASQH